MRIASFNVESLFDRAKALNLPTWQDGRKILEDYAAVNKLLNEPVYTPQIKDQIVTLLSDLGLKKEDASFRRSSTSACSSRSATTACSCSRPSASMG